MRKLPSCLLGAIFVVGVASTTVNAVDGDGDAFELGLFELDGDTIENDVGDDWAGLFNGGANDGGGPDLVTFTGITADPAPVTIFTQGGSKDVNDVSQWKHTNGAVPDKDDITNAYAAAYNNPDDVCVESALSENVVDCGDSGAVIKHAKGDLIIYFGLDRLANNGDANAGFWFFQNEVGLNSGNFVDGDGNPSTHVAKTATTPGDVFVLVKYPQGANAVPLIKAYEWDPNDADGDGNEDPDEKGGKFSPLDLLISETDGECDQSSGKLACAITNHLTLANEPAWDYAPKSGNASDLPFESFYEGGINVTQLLGSTPCFASFLAETRTSESQTAQLKDFVIHEFPVCGAEVDKKCLATIVGNVATVNFSGNVTNTGGQAVFIELTDAPAAVFDAVCIDDGDKLCGTGTDTVPGDLTLGATASFTLGVGETARYEGHYTESPVVDLSFSDTVTMEFFADATSTQALGGDTASDTCLATVVPDIQVIKECDPADGGVRLVVSDQGEVVVEVDNIIKVKNIGEEKLINVLITDSEPAAGIQSLVDNSANISCNATTGECTGSLNIGEEVIINQTYRPDGGNITGNLDNPNTVFFNNTATGAGDGVFSGGHVSAFDDASCELCPPDPVP